MKHVIAFSTWLGFVATFGNSTIQAAEPVDYLRDIKPFFMKRCVACHGTLKVKAGLRLDTAKSMLKGGDNGPALVAGNSEESLLIEAVTGGDDWRMPPEGEGERLNAQEVSMLKAWIDQGAKAPAVEAEADDPRKHWAFQKPTHPEPPAPLPGQSHSENPIDAFLGAEHAKKKITPVPQADKLTLIRRVTLDLTGLAPTPTEVQAFVEDKSPDAYEKVVDRLLASHRYGERWGRHWMDVWRYSDWDGYNKEVRESQPHIWRWRDWIVESLNQDKGYDRMVVEMLAADEANPGDPKSVRATGYLVRNWYKFNRNVWLDNIVEHTSKAFLGVTLNCARCHDHKYDPIDHDDYYQFRAFFEPHDIRTDRVPGQADTTKDGLVRVYDKDPKTPTYLFERGDEKRPAKDKPLEPGLPRVLKKTPLNIQPVSLPSTSYYPGARGYIQEESLSQGRVDAEARRQDRIKATRTWMETLIKDAIATEADRTKARAASRASAATVFQALLSENLARRNLESLEARIEADRAAHANPPDPNAKALASKASHAERLANLAKADLDLQAAWVAAEQALNASAISVAYRPGKTAKAKGPARKLKIVDLAGHRTAFAAAVKKRGEALKAQQAAVKAAETTGTEYSKLGPVYPATSTGRRLALANWIASTENPLTARVAVNHVWLRHFGSPLVDSVFDFGVNGKRPKQPALLDWLATSFMDSGWSMKSLHRLMVTSQAYQRQSTASASPSAAANLEIDPQNETLWRMNPRRMEAEVIRDNLLQVAGRLDESLGGPDLDPTVGLTSGRRSLYFRHAKEKRVMFLKLFDSANATSCYRRSESVVPQQALALTNSPIAFEQSRILAAKISKEIPESKPEVQRAAFVKKAFNQILGRPPAREELAACEAYLAKLSDRLADHSTLSAFGGPASSPVKPSDDPAQRARESLVHVLFNHNDFVTIR